MAQRFRRLRSLLRGEVSAVELERRRRAGASAYSLAEEAADATGDDRGTRLFRLCAWNAFALQTIADTILDVDSRGDPGTAGYVRRSTLNYVGSCLDCVPMWLRAARIVQSDPDANIDVPGSLPRWQLDRPTTHIELDALRGAYDALQPRLESDLHALAAQADDERIRRLKRLFAEMTAAVEYANALDDPGAGPVERGEVRWRLLDALDNAFLLGQLLAVPTLADVVSLDRNGIDRPSIAAAPRWSEIEPSWPVLDCTGTIIGHTERARGDRSTGVLECIDVDPGTGHATLRVPAANIAEIRNGEIRLAVTREEIT